MNLDEMDPSTMGDYLSANRTAIYNCISTGNEIYPLASYIHEQNQQLKTTISRLYDECITDVAQASISAHMNPTGIHSNRFEHDETYQILSSGQKLFLSEIREEHRQFCERMLKRLRLHSVVYCLEDLPDSYREILIEFYIDRKRCYEISSAGKGSSQSSRDRGKRAALKELCNKYNRYITTNENLPVIISSLEDTINDFKSYVDDRFWF